MTPGQRLTAWFCDQIVEQGANDMIRMKGHMARVAHQQYRVGVDELGMTENDALVEVERAITEFVRRRLRNPEKLDTLMVELAQNHEPDPAARPDVRRQANQWVETNGWPTGARFVRGSHSGTYVYDPLGTEPLPPWYEWPYDKPSFDEICRALDA